MLFLTITILASLFLQSAPDIASTWLEQGVTGAAVLALAATAYALWRENKRLNEKIAQDAKDREDKNAQLIQLLKQEERERTDRLMAQLKEVANQHGQAMSVIETSHTDSLKAIEAAHSKDEDRRLEKQLTDTAQLRETMKNLIAQMIQGQERQAQGMDQLRTLMDKTVLTMERLSSGFTQLVDNVGAKRDIEEIRQQVEQLRK